MELLYDQNKWFTPRFAVQYLSRLYKKHGEVVLKSNKYKKEREAWILGLALLGMYKRTGNLWWVQVPIEDPPDMLAMTIVENKEKNQNDMHHREVEIVQITNFSQNTIENAILNKLKNKSYIKETSLVVYMNRDEYIADMNEIAGKLKGEIKIADIWIVAATKPDSSEHILFSLFPDVQVINFDIYEEVAKIPTGDQMELVRGKGINMSLIEKVAVTKFIPD